MKTNSKKEAFTSFWERYVPTFDQLLRLSCLLAIILALTGCLAVVYVFVREVILNPYGH